MGGKLVGSRRMTPDEFQETTNTLISALSPVVKTLDMRMPMHYRSKDSFGDIDFIMKHLDGSETLAREAVAKLGVTEIFESCGTDDPNFSFDYNNTQVDFMFFPAETFEFAARYISLNSLGMVIGIMCRHAGFKLGTNGLLLPIYHPTRKTECLSMLPVSTNFDHVLRFLDLDPKRHSDGFEGMREMHEYVTASPYFSRDFFTLGALNHNRRRKLKYNKMYVELKAFLETRPELERVISSTQTSLERAYLHFPGLKERANKVIQDALDRDARKKKISREDMALLFDCIDVPLLSRRDFIKQLTPKVFANNGFDQLSPDEKRAWFLANQPQLKEF